VVAINPADSEKQKNVTFHWSYIMLPAAVLLFTLVFVAVFYGRLPGELAYSFSAGEPDRLMDRGSVLVWALVLQFVFTILSLAITLIVTFAVSRMDLSETPQTRRLFAIIGNVLVLPQIIIAYATVDIFLYNIYEIRLMPVFTFAVGVMVVGALTLATVFIPAFSKSRRARGKKNQE
jgi:uncharacterized membrane protein